MQNYIVTWSDGTYLTESFLVVAESFSSAADIVMNKKSFAGIIEALYFSNLSIDKNMGSNVFYIKMGGGSEFFVTSTSWNDTKDWVYQALGSDIDVIMSMGMQYVF